MRNEKLRQKKLARNKKKREHHNKVYDQRQRCESGSIYAMNREQRYNDEYEKFKRRFAL